MPKAISPLKMCILLFCILMLSGMSGCPPESERGAGAGSDIEGGSDAGGGSGY
jgi:hypothetical protein